MNNLNYFSHKMKENMKIIDDLISKGFKIESNNFFKSIVKTPEGKSLLLIEIPFGRKQNNKYESDYPNTIFPEFSWLAFFLPVTCFLRIKHYPNFLIYGIWMILLPVIPIKIMVTSSLLIRFIAGKIYPYLVYDSYKKINFLKNLLLWVSGLIEIVFFLLRF